MLVPLTPLMWSSIQISLLVLVVPIIAFFLRGRHPQITSAIFAGSSLAILLLGLIDWLPSTQWSLSNLNSDTKAHENVGAKTNAAEATSTPLANVSVKDSTGKMVEFQPTEPQPASANSRSLGLQLWIERALSWTMLRVQQMDDTVRAFQSAPNKLRWLCSLLLSDNSLLQDLRNISRTWYRSVHHLSIPPSGDGSYFSTFSTANEPRETSNCMA
jgi:hypothetical protein